MTDPENLLLLVLPSGWLLSSAKQLGGVVCPMLIACLLWAWPSGRGLEVTYLDVTCYQSE